MKEIKLNALKLGLAGGIIGAIFIFLTTILGVLGYSEAYIFLLSSFWGNIGYSLSLIGALIGAIFGFIWAFVLFWVLALLYNKLTS